MTTDLTAETLREHLSYDPETGVFTRLKGYGQWKVGDVAGFMAGGYLSIGVGYERFRAHRLAWLYMTGAWPTDTVDHIDRNKTNNRWENLRMATLSEQAINRDSPRSRTGRLMGAYYRAERSKWTAQIKIHGVIHFLGYFYTEAEAHAAYLAAKEKLHVIETYPKEAA